MDTSPARSTVEEMGLRREDAARLLPLDAILVVALVLSAAAWVWVSLVGVAPDLVAALASPAGRVVAAAIGLASVVAVVRAFVVLRWPAADSERSLL